MEFLVIGLICVVVVLEILHYRERKDLYNRIMSRDIKEYKSAVETKSNEEKQTRQQKLREKWINKRGEL